MKTGKQISIDSSAQYYLNDGKTLCQDGDQEALIISVSKGDPISEEELDQKLSQLVKQADWDESESTDAAYIKNKPIIVNPNNYVLNSTLQHDYYDKSDVDDKFYFYIQESDEIGSGQFVGPNITIGSGNNQVVYVTMPKPPGINVPAGATLIVESVENGDLSNVQMFYLAEYGRPVNQIMEEGVGVKFENSSSISSIRVLIGYVCPAGGPQGLTAHWRIKYPTQGINAINIVKDLYKGNSDIVQGYVDSEISSLEDRLESDEQNISTNASNISQLGNQIVSLTQNLNYKTQLRKSQGNNSYSSISQIYVDKEESDGSLLTKEKISQLVDNKIANENYITESSTKWDNYYTKSQIDYLYTPMSTVDVILQESDDLISAPNLICSSYRKSLDDPEENCIYSTEENINMCQGQIITSDASKWSLLKEESGNNLSWPFGIGVYKNKNDQFVVIQGGDYHFAIFGSGNYTVSDGIVHIDSGTLTNYRVYDTITSLTGKLSSLTQRVENLEHSQNTNN